MSGAVGYALSITTSLENVIGDTAYITLAFHGREILNAEKGRGAKEGQEKESMFNHIAKPRYFFDLSYSSLCLNTSPLFEKETLCFRSPQLPQLGIQLLHLACLHINARAKRLSRRKLQKSLLGN
jgi:hypothetical protein